MNDWEIKKFLKVVIATQLAMLGAIGLDTIGLDIPIVRQVIGFIFLTFIPGIVILRVLKLHKLNTTEVLLYSVGLSITFVMFLGFFMNMLYPLISKPISTSPVMVALTIAVVILCVVAYKRESVQRIAHSGHHSVWWSEITSQPALFLFSLPLLSVLGTYLVNFHDNNTLLLVLLAVLSIIPGLVAFNWIPKNLYPLAVVSIAISLLFHNSLISRYLVEWADISWEYYFSKTVLTNSLWDWAIPTNCNAMLSIVILAPLFAEACKLDLTWVFKIIYPILFSLVPLGIYHVVQKQTTQKIAFLSCFFFMSMFTFYTTTLGLARFQIAALFLVLLLLFVVGKKMGWKRALLSIVFSFSLIVSHYALSSILLLIFIVALGLLISRICGKNYNNMITNTFVLLYVASTMTWSMYITSGSIFRTLVLIGDSIGRDFFTHFLDPKFAQGLNILVRETSMPLHQLSKYINLVTQFFIAVGILIVLMTRRERKFKTEYLALSLVSFGVCLAGLVVPHFAATINTERLYHLSLLFLSPFCVIGGITVFRKTSNLIKSLVKTRWARDSIEPPIKALSVFFAVYLLINSGLIYELANQPINVPVSLSRVWQPHFNEQEVSAAMWLSDNMNASIEIHADLNNAYLSMMMFGVFSPLQGDKEVITYISNKAYIFLGRENVADGKIRLEDPTHPRIMNTLAPLRDLMFYNTLLNSNKIYDCGDAQVFYHAHMPYGNQNTTANKP